MSYHLHPQNLRDQNFSNATAETAAISMPTFSTPRPLGPKTDQKYETQNINGDDFVKIKGDLIFDFKILKMGDKSWSFLKMLVALGILELFHNITVPEHYLATLTSHLYKICVNSTTTYIPSGPSSILWGKVSMKWITGGAFTPLQWRKMSSNFNHSFPLVTPAGIVSRISYRVNYVQTHYIESQAELLTETGYVYIETMCKELKCKNEILFMFKIRQNMQIFSYDTVLKQMEALPTITSNSESVKVGTWDLSNFNAKKPNKVSKMVRGIVQSSSSKELEHSVTKGSREVILSLPWK